VRVAHSGLCLGIRDGLMTSDAEVLQRPCDNKGDQTFMIDLMSPVG
jgi:hypothetical protein